MKRKFLYILILSLLLVPLVPFNFVKAANNVSLTADIIISLTSPVPMDLTLASGDSYNTMTVTADTISITVSAEGIIHLGSADGHDLVNDRSQTNCSGTASAIIFSVAAGGSDDTITITPKESKVCGSSSSSSGGGGGGGSSTTSTITAPSGTQSASKTVDGSEGGSISTTDNRAGFELPAGLATSNVSMNIIPSSSSGYGSPQSGYSAVAGQVYNFSLSVGGSALTQFSQSVTLNFSYKDDDIAGLDESSLKIYYWNGLTWVLVGGTIDATSNKITATVNHFTTFAIFGQKTSDEVGGDLIKLVCPAGADINNACKSVYYLGGDNKRYVFPNEITYNSWYADFSSVKTVASDVMASYSIGGNVTMRPGTHMIKITTDPKVYAVESGGKLRWVDSEETAINLYGVNWTKKIVDVSDAFFINYDNTNAVENKITSAHPIGSLIKYAGSSDVYYVAGENVKRLISTDGMSANRFRNEFVIETDIIYDNGAEITGAEADLKNTVNQ